MKTLQIICLLLICASLATAQEEHSKTGWNKHETLFSKARVIGGFGGPIVSFSKIENETTSFVGVGGGLIVNNFFIGLYGIGSTRMRNRQNRISTETANLAHGGIWLGYTSNQYKLIHLFSTVKIGSGAVVYTTQKSLDTWDMKFEDADQIFAIAPEIGLELNIFRFFKIAFTGGYRWVEGLNKNDVRKYTNSDFSSATGSISFRFGGFGSARY